MRLPRVLLVLPIISILPGAASSQDCADYGAHPRYLGAAPGISYANRTFAVEDHVYVEDDGGQWRVLDCADPQDPLDLGGLPVGGVVRQFAAGARDGLGHPLVLMEMEGGGLSVFDFAEPLTPSLVATIALDAPIRLLAVDGSIAALITESGDGRLFDLTQASAPAPAGSFGTDSTTTVLTLTARTVVHNYLLTVLPGWEVIVAEDFQIPEAPVTVMQYLRTTTASELSTIEGIWCRDGTVWYAVRDYNIIPEEAGPSLYLHSVPLSLHPEPGATGLAFLGNQELAGLDWTDGAAIVTLEDAVLLVDTTDPAAPAVSGQILTPGGTRAAALLDGHPLSADGPRGLNFYALGDGYSPVPNYLDLPHYAEQFVTDGDLVYCDFNFYPRTNHYARDVVRLEVLGFSDPASPVSIGVLDSIPGRAVYWDLAVGNGTLYASTFPGIGFSGYLDVIDVSSAEDPVLVANVLNEPLDRIEHCRGTLFGLVEGGTYGSGLLILSLTDPQAPAIVGHVPVDLPKDLACSPTHLFLVHNDQGAGMVSVFDIADPGHPAAAGVYAHTGPLTACVRYGGYLLVTGERELLILDISVPSAPVRVGSVALAGAITRVAAGWGYAYVATVGAHWYSPGAVCVVDWFDPQHPELLGELPGWAGDLGMVRDTALVATSGLGRLPAPCGISPVPSVSAGGGIIVSCYPNPFNPRVRIEFAVRRNASLRVEVFDLRGRLVRVLADRWQDAGLVAIDWDGLRGDGEPAPAGAYLVKVQSGAEAGRIKLTLLK